MKLSQIISVLIFGLTITLMSSCLNEDNKIPPNCYDGILNNGEEAIDCGGPNCDACDPCTNGVWNPELGETWVDCGGDCGPCPTSANGCQDGDEEAVDCGGSTGIPCDGLCDDGLPNGYEDNAAVDCLTPPGFPPDCGGFCEPCPTCDDGVMNQAEIGIDCGGSGCPDCATDGSCLNGFVDGDEVYIDCYTDADATGYCPQCDTYLSATISGVEVQFDAALSGLLLGNQLVIQASSSTGHQINIVINEPDTGWPLFYAGGLGNIITNMTNTDAAVIYTDPLFPTDPFSSLTGTGGTINVSYVDTDAPGFCAATFNGSLGNAGGTSSRTISDLTVRTFVN